MHEEGLCCRQHCFSKLLPGFLQAPKEQPVEAPRRPDADSVQSFAVDVELEGDDQDMPVDMEPALPAVPPLLAKPQHTQVDAEEETFLVGIEMDEEDTTHVEQPAGGADASKAPEVDQAVAAAAAETRSQFLQAMRAVRDVKELDACPQCGRVHQGLPTKGLWARKTRVPCARCQHENGPIQAAAASKAAEDLQVRARSIWHVLSPHMYTLHCWHWLMLQSSCATVTVLEERG